MAEMLNLSRMYNAVAAVAAMRRSVVEAFAHAQSRVTFGKRVADHPLMQETLLDLASAQRAALLWAFRGVELLDRSDNGEATSAESAALRILTPLLKYYTGKVAVGVASEGVEALGGNGYIEDWPMARVLRDAQVLTIWEGTTNILVLDAFRAIRKQGAHEGYFAEVDGLLADADASVAKRLRELVDELKASLATLGSDTDAVHVLRDWTDRACLVWELALLASARFGGTAGDVRAARRLLARHVRAGLLRQDRATAADVQLVAFG
jgi:hypothetical protein